jgi:hypothetical protein
MTKKIIRVEEYSEPSITEYSTLGEVKIEVERLIALFGTDANIEFSAGYENISETVTYERLETDTEHLQRLKSEARERDLIIKKEDKERKEWERLNKKYGGGK